jgi:acyl-CoA thioester hydrolase
MLPAMHDMKFPAAIPAPFESVGIQVLPEWIDANGHMNIAYYVAAFDRAFDQVYDQFGFTRAMMRERNASSFTSELHVTYQRELMVGDPIRVTTQLLGFDAKRCHFVQCMYHARDGYLASTLEWLLLYIDMTARRVAVMPEDLQRHLARVVAAHQAVEVPPEVGRRISLEAKRPR